MYVVSMCLAGIPCRYDGKDNLVPQVAALLKRNEAIAVCPAVRAAFMTAASPVQSSRATGYLRKCS